VDSGGVRSQEDEPLPLKMAARKSGFSPVQGRRQRQLHPTGSYTSEVVTFHHSNGIHDQGEISGVPRRERQQDELPIALLGFSPEDGLPEWETDLGGVPARVRQVPGWTSGGTLVLKQLRSPRPLLVPSCDTSNRYNLLRYPPEKNADPRRRIGVHMIKAPSTRTGAKDRVRRTGRIWARPIFRPRRYPRVPVGCG
jgi:hypothetical protein